MKIAVACDSFKGSLTAYEVCQSIKSGIAQAAPEAEVVCLPVADGGEGTSQCFFDNCAGKLVEVETVDCLGKKITARYTLLIDGTAVIDTAAASGITLIDKKYLNPMAASTYGTGIMIKDAVIHGAKKLIIGLGGSATNDGGAGALSALGIRFADSNGCKVTPCGAALSRISEIEFDKDFNNYKNIEITLACDVENPFYGKTGAAYVFAPQKGASGEDVEKLDFGLKNFAKKVEEKTGVNLQTVKGSGAAGGLAGGLYAFLNCKIQSGFSVLSRQTDFMNKIKGSDFIITGEGRTDTQTSFGKLPLRVCEAACELGIDCILLSGDIEPGLDTAAMGFCMAYRLCGEEISTQYAIDHAAQLLETKAYEITEKRLGFVK